MRTLINDGLSPTELDSRELACAEAMADYYDLPVVVPNRFCVNNYPQYYPREIIEEVPRAIPRSYTDEDPNVVPGIPPVFVNCYNFGSRVVGAVGQRLFMMCSIMVDEDYGPYPGAH